MANTYTLISSNVLASSAASVTFSAIPSTYTDLVIRMTARSTAAVSITTTFNGSSSSVYSKTQLSGEGTGVYNYRQTSGTSFQDTPFMTSNAYASDIFNSAEMYIPNYAGSTYKPMSVAYGVPDTTVSNELTGAIAALFSNTSAISSITLASASGSFVSGSSFYLYGIKNS